MVGILAAVGPFFSLPSSFLRGTAAAGGIALVNAIATVGGFAGPYVIGVLREATGGYAASMVALAVGLVVSAIIVLATGRAMASRKVKSPSPNAGLRAEQIAGGDLPTES
jgi:ACS family tartrate transporter-like MFS transporter